MITLCSRCRMPAADEAYACASCGGPLVQVPAGAIENPLFAPAGGPFAGPERCGACGAALVAGAGFCDKCGVPTFAAGPGAEGIAAQRPAAAGSPFGLSVVHDARVFVAPKTHLAAAITAAILSILWLIVPLEMLLSGVSSDGSLSTSYEVGRVTLLALCLGSVALAVTSLVKAVQVGKRQRAGDPFGAARASARALRYASIFYAKFGAFLLAVVVFAAWFITYYVHARDQIMKQPAYVHLQATRQVAAEFQRESRQSKTAESEQWLADILTLHAPPAGVTVTNGSSDVDNKILVLGPDVTQPATSTGVPLTYATCITLSPTVGGAPTLAAAHQTAPDTVDC